ncbi:MAG: hypothetical protein ACTSPV_08645 [Candidatus Hodarchaeales archaeon]
MSRLIKTLYGLIGAATVIGVIGAIGSTCVAWDPKWWAASEKLAIIGEYHLIFKAVYIITWLVAIAWAVIFWALKTGKPWFYKAALVNCILGLTGFIKIVILFIGGMKFAPAWFRMIIHIAILVVLLNPKYRDQIQDFVEKKSSSEVGSSGSQVANFSYVLIGSGLALILQPLIMPTHIIDGLNVAISFGEPLATGMFQLVTGILCISLGVAIQIITKLVNAESTTKKPVPSNV